MWLEDVLYGALAPGVNRPTVVMVNVALMGCLLSLIFLLFVAVQVSWSLAAHVCVLLALALALLILFNWFMQQVGLVSVSDQKQQLFGPEESSQPAGQSDEQHGTAKEDSPALRAPHQTDTDMDSGGAPPQAHLKAA